LFLIFSLRLRVSAVINSFNNMRNYTTDLKKRSSVILKVLRLVWECNPRLVTIIFFSTILTSLLPFAQTVVGKYVLDSIISAVESHGVWADVRAVLIFVGLEFFLVALSRNFTLFVELQREILGEQFSKSTSTKIVSKTISLDLAHFEDAEYYDKLQKAQRDGNYRPVQLLNQMFTLLQNIVSIGSFFTLLLLFKWYFLFLIILATAPRTFVQFFYAKKKYNLINNRTPEQRKVSYFSFLLSNNISVKEIKLFQLGRFFLDKYSAALTKFYNENVQLAGKRTKANVFANIIAILSTYGAYAIIIYNTILGTITIGSMTMYYQAFTRSQSSLDSFLKAIAGLYENMLYVNNYLEFIGMKVVIESESRESIVDSRKKKEFESAELRVEREKIEQSESLKPWIRFEGVSFGYPKSGPERNNGKKSTVLENLSFDIKRGEVIAFVGENGAGKTTIVKLLTRLYDPTEGNVFFCGKNMRDIPPDSIRKNISVVFQDFNHYQILVRENIAVGDLNHFEDMEKIKTTSELSGADGFIQNLTQGYDTQLGRWFEKGQELSIGQWQRIALARGFMKDAPILIFDEPTSHIDAKAEAEIFDSIEKFRKDKIIIIISHRLKTVRTADKIIVLEKGKITEQGKHDELMEKNGLYATMFNLQARGYGESKKMEPQMNADKHS